jgi:hypothetical protein
MRGLYQSFAVVVTQAPVYSPLNGGLRDRVVLRISIK